ncbi:MAG: hypothetical protein COC03_02325 [Robiginitomaculum sp.]|nr:MAG: hypothetical protein COC03_03965 [Robiginitomaculum sp.]PHQ60457.1 MAG: hypothetical protein COC03_02325 [Robiginitomaculum sp.]PHQ68116.1 MAG: hypothetical protein COB92_02155 [Robiginitomaculum sp.]
MVGLLTPPTTEKQAVAQCWKRFVKLLMMDTVNKRKTKSTNRFAVKGIVKRDKRFKFQKSFNLKSVFAAW